MQTIEFLKHNPFFFIGLVTLLGLLVGSFLNVLIYRAPRMLKNEWRQQCTEFLELPTTGVQQAFNLLQPRSHCPHCQQAVRVWQNIPVISYLLLKGKCGHCQHAISLRYPLIEFASALIAFIVAQHFAVSYQTIAALILSWSLLSMSFIDIDHQLLPDNMTLGLLWLGLLLNLNAVFTDLDSAVIGAIAGYLSLWSFSKLFKLATQKDGMGHGDFKLLAMFGAWFGWQILPLIILMASFVGAVIGLLLILFKYHKFGKPIPFGPYLALAGWLTMLMGDKIMLWYQQVYLF